jgi:hypothetical protein
MNERSGKRRVGDLKGIEVAIHCWVKELDLFRGKNLQWELICGPLCHAQT